MSLLALMAEKFEVEPPPPDVNDDANNNWHRVTYARERGRSVDENDDNIISFADLLHSDNDNNTGTPLKKHMSISEASSAPQLDRTSDDASPQNRNNNSNSSSDDKKLLITFLLMVIIGTINKIFQKLQAIPMYNYPNTLNLLQNFIYVPLCFIYIIPVQRYALLNNAIPNEVQRMNKKPFVILGLLDCITCLLFTFAAVYLPGSLLILLPQAAIPISMLLSKYIKGEWYAIYQYLGAIIVILGILVVLEPLITQRHSSDYVCVAYDEDEFCSVCVGEVTEEGCLSHSIEGGADDSDNHQPWNVEGDSYMMMLRSLAQQQSNDTASGEEVDDHDGKLCFWAPSDSQSSSSGSSATSTTLLWSVVAILACIPMTLSSIYKEVSLSGSQTNIDPIFLNGWVALYQLFFSFPLSVPAGMTSSPPVPPSELPGNILDGIKCYLGIGTITTGCHSDDMCDKAPLYVNVFLFFNVAFNILIVYILKYGSANVLFMASTVMVPIGNLAFALPFMPGSMPLQDSDIVGLLVMLLGLVTYWFGSAFRCRLSSHWMATIAPLRRLKQRSSTLNGDEEWNTLVFNDDDDMNVVSNGLGGGTLSVLEEPLLYPLR